MTRKSKTKRAAMSVTRNLMLAPAVMALRIPTLAADAAGMADGAETSAAIREKMTAFAEGVVAAQLAWAGSMMMMPFALASAKSPMAPILDMVEAVSTAALAPAGRQVRRNHRRLAGKA